MPANYPPVETGVILDAFKQSDLVIDLASYGTSIYRPLRTEVSHNTLHVAVKDEESRVLALVTALAARGRVLRIEINSASLEDIFIELTQKGAGA